MSIFPIISKWKKSKSQQSLFGVGDLADISSKYTASCTPLDSFWLRPQFDTSGRPHLCGIKESCDFTRERDKVSALL